METGKYWINLYTGHFEASVGGVNGIKSNMMAKENKQDKDAELKTCYEATRKSLIARLQNWEDQRTWDEFYKTYWRLIYSVAMKSGLRSDEAFDVVQETILGIAKQSKENRYDPNAGSFKSWLLNMTRWRIGDQFRKRKKDTAMSLPDRGDDDRNTSVIERMEDPNGGTLDKVWDAEWADNLTQAALQKVKSKVSVKQFQIYDCYVVKGWDTRKVARELGVSVTQVYLAKHRVGAILKKEISQIDGDAF